MQTRCINNICTQKPLPKQIRHKNILSEHPKAIYRRWQFRHTLNAFSHVCTMQWCNFFCSAFCPAVQSGVAQKAVEEWKIIHTQTFVLPVISLDHNIRNRFFAVALCMSRSIFRRETLSRVSHESKFIMAMSVSYTQQEGTKLLRSIEEKLFAVIFFMFNLIRKRNCTSEFARDKKVAGDARNKSSLRTWARR